jgi:hypothetical protein
MRSKAWWKTIQEASLEELQQEVKRRERAAKKKEMVKALMPLKKIDTRLLVQACERRLHAILGVECGGIATTDIIPLAGLVHDVAMQAVFGDDVFDRIYDIRVHD